MTNSKDMDIKQQMGFSLLPAASDGFKFNGDEKTCIDFQNEVDEKKEQKQQQKWPSYSSVDLCMGVCESIPSSKASTPPKKNEK